MDFLLRYEVWFILALALVAIDVFIGLDFILFSFGIGAGLTGASIFFEETVPLPYTTDWESLLTFFAVTSLVILVPLRYVVRKTRRGDEGQDINRY
jgi:membrane protein implicated in regulation of membrane protease activity